MPPPKTPPPQRYVAFDDFYAYMGTRQYLYIPTRELWPAASVDSRLPKRNLLNPDGSPGAFVKASIWLDKHRSIEQMTWAPGAPVITVDRLVADGGWFSQPGAACYNLYRPPVPQSHGDASLAGVWLDHLRMVYPDDVDHLVRWFAYVVQHPATKINHAIVLGGAQGIGKDSLLEPVKLAVGAWNFTEISPSHLMGSFNGWAKSRIVRINEAHDLGDVNRYALYDRLKIYTASPPDVLRVNEKHLREHAIFNVCAVIITTNHKTDGLYLPPDDRRHYVAWSPRRKADFEDAYFTDLYGWYQQQDGLAHVVAYLQQFDLRRFDPKLPPPHTAAWLEITQAGLAPEDAEMADALDILHLPDILSADDLQADLVPQDFRAWLKDRRNRRIIPHKLAGCGYVPVRNPTAKDGLWRLHGRRQALYAKDTLSPDDRLQLANDYTRQ